MRDSLSEERGRGSGIDVDTRIAFVCTLRDGRLERLVFYEESDEALAAVGLTAEAG